MSRCTHTASSIIWVKLLKTIRRCVIVDIDKDDFQHLVQHAAEGRPLDGVAHLLASDINSVGEVKGVVDSAFAFEDVHKAYERLMSNRACGKVVVKVDPNVE